ncbi:MAG: M28 family peptidase [Solirubrobacterales bacterium]|nr:M28 family peptidase [Solirubrobacterales bacterium]
MDTRASLSDGSAVTDTSQDGQHWQSAIHELSAFKRPSASAGERRAAEWIAERLRGLGLSPAVEEERAHGGYWWPLAVANALGAAGGAIGLRGPGRRRRALAAILGAAGATAAWDDVTGRGFRFRGRLFPHRSTWNVVAEAGDSQAERTVIVVAHHDAAHSGLVFHPALGQIAPRLFPRLHERASHTFPIMHAVWAGPLLVLGGAALGSRRLLRAGLGLAVGAIVAMVDIAARPVVPGANDNLTAVAVLLALAESLRDRPLGQVRVLLVSTGSEESFSEGMLGFTRRHFPSLDPARTEVLCLECLGSSRLLVVEGEGMLRIQDYPEHMREELAAAAAEAGVAVARGLRTVAATDGLISMRAGYPTVTLASIDETGLPRNYHWPTDTAQNLDWDTLESARAVCDRFLRRRGTES